MKTALIAGHSGLVGGELLQLLLNSDKYNKVIAVGRREIDVQHPKLTQQIVDFNKLEIDGKVDDIFCCLGTTIKKAGSQEKFRLVDYQYPINLGLAGLKAGASAYLLVSAHGASANSSIFYSRVKGEVEEGIQSLKSQLSKQNSFSLSSDNFEKITWKPEMGLSDLHVQTEYIGIIPKEKDLMLLFASEKVN